MGGSRSHVIYWGGEKFVRSHEGCPRDTSEPDDPRLCGKCRRAVQRRLDRKAGR